MGAALQFSFQFRTTVCCNCGISFAWDESTYERRINDKGTFYCPNGHPQHFTGESEAEKLKKQLARKEQELKWAEESRANAWKAEARQTRKASAYKGVITKTRARIGRGICPCCNRQFQNLQKHMTHLHPEFKTVKGKIKWA